MVGLGTIDVRGTGSRTCCVIPIETSLHPQLKAISNHLSQQFKASGMGFSSEFVAARWYTRR